MIKLISKIRKRLRGPQILTIKEARAKLRPGAKVRLISMSGESAHYIQRDTFVGRVAKLTELGYLCFIYDSGMPYGIFIKDDADGDTRVEVL